MLVNVHHDSPAEHARLLLAGTVFLTVIATLIGLSIAVYNKAFEPVTMVTVKADRAGLQLAKFGDVRVNGALVGQVREISQDGREASIEVGLRPEAAKAIPADVRVEILPTTLFGQKYLAFVPTGASSAESIADGDVIESDRVTTNVELSRILANLFPLLRAVRPADLNATLNALATALDGRGERIGQTLDRLDSYLGAIADDLPTLRQDLRLLADVADTYSIAAPDLLALLRNATVTSRTVLDHKAELAVFFGDVAGTSDVATRLLRDNEENLIDAGRVSEPVLGLLADYSPQFPCLLRGLDRYGGRLGEVFEGDQIKQYIELLTPQYKPYGAGDKPVYGEVGHGPWCLGLPDPPVPAPGPGLDDGSDINENPPDSPLPQLPSGASGPATETSSGAAGRAAYRSQAAAYRGAARTAGSEAERTLLRALAADDLGAPVGGDGSLLSLFYGPLVRGGAR